MIAHLGHPVLTTANVAACIDAPTRVRGMTLNTFTGGAPPIARRAFTFGQQKINLHVKRAEFEPKAHLPVSGALGLRFTATVLLQPFITILAREG